MTFSQPYVDPAMEREVEMNPVPLQIDSNSKFKTIGTLRSARSRRESRNAHVHASTIVSTRVLLLLVGFPLMIVSTYADNIDPTSSNRRPGLKRDNEYPHDHYKYLALREKILQEIHNVKKTDLEEKEKSPNKAGNEMGAGIDDNNQNRGGDLLKLEDHINNKNGKDTRRKNETNLRRRSLEGNENINVHVDIETKTATDDQVASDEVSKEASYGGDFGGGYGGGYGRGNGGYGGRNYCPSRCMNSILQAKKCKAWFYDCTRYYGWCGGGGGSYGGYRNLQEKISKQAVTMGEVDHNLDTSGVNVTDDSTNGVNVTDDSTNGVNMTDSTNTTKAASRGYGGDFGYGGGKEYCPYRCMSAIAHAKKCKAYYPSCNGHFGWCGHGGHGGFGGGGGYGGGYDGGFGGGYDGGFDGGYDVGFDGRHDGGFDGGHDGGFDGRHDGGFDGRYDGGFDGRHDGGFGGRYDGGFVGGHGGGFDGGYDEILEGRGDYDGNDANTYDNTIGGYNN